MQIAVVIPAAGFSSRYAEAGGMRHKLDEDLGGRPVLHRTVELFTKPEQVSQIIVAGPHDQVAFDDFRERHGAKLGFYGVTLCRGGETHRWETVRNAIETVADDATHIAVHDAARPCASELLIERVFDAAQNNTAVIPAVEVGDTIKRTEEASDAGEADPLDAVLGGGGKANAAFRRVTETLDRAGLVAVQTPQAFERAFLERAYAQDDLSATDDAALVERLGEPVIVVEGEATNIKITRPADLALARAILGVRGPKERPAHKRF